MYFMVKKTFVVLMSALLLLSASSGCSPASQEESSGNSQSSSSSTSDASQEETAQQTGEPDHIVFETLYFDAVPRELETVEAAINDITIPEINVEVELYPLSMSDAATQVSLMISSGSQMDLVVSMNRSEYLSLVNKNMLLDLQDLLEQYGQGIVENAPNAIVGGYVGDALYGIPSVEKYGNSYGLMISKEVTDAVGWDKFDDVSIEELGEFLALAHEKFPDKTLIQLSGGANNVNNFNMLYDVDYLSATIGCGGIMGIGSEQNDQIVNVFATPEYKEFCDTMRQWYQAGYFNEDAATCTESPQSYITTGQSLGFLTQTELDMVPSQSTATGVELVAINTRPHTLVTENIASGLWSIPYTCENPEAVMKFMNLMWDNDDIINLIYYGVEGVTYQFADDDSGRITYMDGENAQTCGFRQWFGIYGNTPRRLTWIDLPADYQEQLEEFNNSVDETNTSKYLGYAFDPNTVKTQYAAVQDVISTYRTSLECGVVDPASVLPEFLEALDNAGINTIIEANQASLDAWIAEQ